jgi:thiamine transport system substrate-binding protein
MIARSLLRVIALALLLAGCVPLQQAPAPVGLTVAPAATPASQRTVAVMTHDSFSVSQKVVDQFQAQCGCVVRFLKSGDAGLALNKAILSKDVPLADVFFGVDNTFLSRALQAGIFEPYASPELAGIPAELKLDPSNQLLPVDFGYVNLNYDKKYFAEKNLPLPKTLRDLTDPKYRGLVVVENPATSSPGLAFLLTTVAVFGEQGDYTYLNFWSDLRNNDVQVSDGWEDAYNSKFSGGAGGGERPLAVSYATSPAAHPDLARQWVDFMLGAAFQADVPLQMWVYPARTGVPLPEVFQRYAEVPQQPAQVTPEQIDANRERWLGAWTQTVLR